MLTLWFPDLPKHPWNNFKHRNLIPYQIPYKEKILGEDKIDINDVNVMLIPVATSTNFKYSEYLKLIEKCTDLGIQCFIEHTWEIWPVCSISLYEKDTIINYVDHMKEHNVKIISNKEDRRGDNLKDDNVVELFDNLIVHFSQFKYNTRIEQIEMNHHNRRFKMDTHFIARKNKKYNFTALCGSIAKRRNSLLFASLHKRGLLNDSNFWTIINRKRDIEISGLWMNDKEGLIELHPLFEYYFNNKDDIVVERMCDEIIDNEIDGLPEWQERRIPQQYYDSHFSLCIETTREQCFFTEKLYKPISIGLPFLIFGSPYQNTILKDTYGYQIFDEVWDYSFEKQIGGSENNLQAEINYIEAFTAEINRTVKESHSLFYQPSVIDKAEHNRELFEKSTTRNCLIEDLNRIFGEGDYG